MGEKQGKNEEGKEQKEGGGEKKDKAKAQGDAKKKTTAILRLHLHCDACVRKVRRCVRAFDGVEEVVSVDMEIGTVTVAGTMDPWDLRDWVEWRTHKRPVEVVFPKGPRPEKPKKKVEKEEKRKEATVVLRIPLHCDGCIHKIRRTILRFEGVLRVAIEVQKDQVGVTGYMKAEELVRHLREKLRREVEVVPAKEKKDGGGGEEKKKKEEGGGGGDGGGGGEKKKKEAGGGGEAKVELSKLDHYYHLHDYHGGGYFPTHNQMIVHDPQMFSDENPNGCVVM